MDFSASPYSLLQSHTEDQPADSGPQRKACADNERATVQRTSMNLDENGRTLRTSQGNVQELALVSRGLRVSEEATGRHDSDSVELQALGSVHRREMDHIPCICVVGLGGERPPKAAETYAWSERADASFGVAVIDVIKKALSPAPDQRFHNAREMLEALNAATADTPSQIVDVGAFEAYRANTKERDYDETDTLAETKDYLCFRSATEDGNHLVKVWYGVEPDPRKPDLSLRLLSFLERARVVKGMQIAGLHRIVDFGLSRGSLLLVTEWVEGLPSAARTGR